MAALLKSGTKTRIKIEKTVDPDLRRLPGVVKNKIDWDSKTIKNLLGKKDWIRRNSSKILHSFDENEEVK